MKITVINGTENAVRLIGGKRYFYRNSGSDCGIEINIFNIS